MICFVCVILLYLNERQGEREVRATEPPVPGLTRQGPQQRRQGYAESASQDHKPGVLQGQEPNRKYHLPPTQGAESRRNQACRQVICDAQRWAKILPV